MNCRPSFVALLIVLSAIPTWFSPARAEEPLAFCLSREKVAVTGALVSGAQNDFNSTTTRSSRTRSITTRSVLLADAVERQVRGLGAASLRLSSVPENLEAAGLKNALAEARQSRATLMMAILIGTREQAIGKTGWITEDLGPIRTVTLRFQGAVVDVGSGSVLARVELPPQNIAALSAETAIREFSEDESYGAAGAIVAGLRRACEGRSVPTPAIAVSALNAPQHPPPGAKASVASKSSPKPTTTPDGDRLAIAPGRHRALIIGIRDYKNLYGGTASAYEYQRLRYADKDAEDFAAFLRNSGKSGANWDITRLLNEQATARNIHEAIQDFIVSARPSDVVVIFFSGHGASDRTSADDVYLLAHETEADYIAGGIHLNLLKDKIAKSKALQIVTFIDACRAGTAAGKGDDAGFTVMRERIEETMGRMRVTMTGGSGHQQTFEDPDLQHGVYTYFLLKALNTPQVMAPWLPTANGRKDTRLITLQALHDFVTQNVSDHTRKNPGKFPKVQNPAIFGDIGKMTNPENWPLGFVK